MNYMNNTMREVALANIAGLPNCAKQHVKKWRETAVKRAVDTETIFELQIQ